MVGTNIRLQFIKELKVGIKPMEQDYLLEYLISTLQQKHSQIWILMNILKQLEAKVIPNSLSIIIKW